MSNLEIVLTTVSTGLFFAIIVLGYKIDSLKGNMSHLQGLIDLKCDQIKSLDVIIKETEKKNKMSDDVLEILNDIKKGGTLLEVTRVDRNDIFFHNGGLYR